MAGAWPILPTPDDLDLFRVLSAHHLAGVLETLDESGWAAAEERLGALAGLPEYQEALGRLRARRARQTQQTQQPTEDTKGETP